MAEREPFTWRGQRFVWFDKHGSQNAGWESGANTPDGTTIFFSVREVGGDQVAFTAFTTPLLGKSTAPRIVDALEGALEEAKATVGAYRSILVSIK